MQIFESQFPNDYRQEEIKKILDYVVVGKFCQVVCIPGAGKATVLRLLAHNRKLLKFHMGEKEPNVQFAYFNFLDLSAFDEATIAKFLLAGLDEKPRESDPFRLTKTLTESVSKLANSGRTIIFLFDHFDECQNRLPRSFYQTLKTLKSFAKFKFSVVFATRRDLLQLVDEEISRDYWDFFVENAVYLKVFDRPAVDFLFTQIEDVFSKKLTSKEKSDIIQITGGHAKLTKTVAELTLGQNIGLIAENLLGNRQVTSAIWEMWLFLTSNEQYDLFRLSRDFSLNEPDEDLVKLDLVRLKDQSNNLAFTIPIFKEFIKTKIPNVNLKIFFDDETREIKKGESIISELLSPQEERLLRFLIQNPQRVLTRDEIIPQVWPQTQVAEAISDEAIDQMVFRLRKKIEDEPAAPKHILTVKGRGLKFEP